MIASLVRRIGNKLGYTIQPVREPDPYALSFRDVVEIVLSFRPNATFIEIGANDGITNDPLYEVVKEHGLTGTVVEPQPDVFEILKANYEGMPVTCLNAAVATDSGVKILYTVRESAKTAENFKRVTGIASFDKPTLLHTITNKIPKGANPEDYIDETPVDCVTLSELGHADIYQIDCEGYDYEIVKQIDFSLLPLIINFESVHLSAKELKELHTLFSKNGYNWFTHGIDTCAYKVWK